MAIGVGCSGCNQSDGEAITTTMVSGDLDVVVEKSEGSV